jgi:hypothetical protein
MLSSSRFNRADLYCIVVISTSHPTHLSRRSDLPVEGSEWRGFRFWSRYLPWCSNIEFVIEDDDIEEGDGTGWRETDVMGVYMQCKMTKQHNGRMVDYSPNK